MNYDNALTDARFELLETLIKGYYPMDKALSLGGYTPEEGKELLDNKVIKDVLNSWRRSAIMELTDFLHKAVEGAARRGSVQYVVGLLDGLTGGSDENTNKIVEVPVPIDDY